MKTIILFAAVALLSACAHQWTPDERAELARRKAERCNGAVTQPQCATLWRADSGQPMPLPVERALQGR